MGQGYSMTTLSAASATIDVPELSDLAHDKTLASARFTKSLRARSQQGFVFVKAIMKPFSAFNVREYVKQITEERNMLAAIPNALGYQRIVEVASGGFLVRQYMHSSMYDRLSTRPFLEDIEKRWLSYQLLCAVRDCHAQNLYHGDIKTENLLVTSWNWLYLTDFSSCLKPTHLPEDNPADFSFFFDTSSRRVCYLAPERFTSQNANDAPQELNWAMDMFSVGCAIAEMFLEGPIFTLSQIFKYKSGDYNPEHAHINKIEDTEVRAMVLNMIDLDPEKRYSAEQHLGFYKSRIFPEYFYSFLHDYMQDLTEPVLSDTHLTLDSEILAESDRKIDRVHHDYDKIAYFLGYSDSPHSNDADATIVSHQRRKTTSLHLEPHIDNVLHDGTLLFLALVSAAMRNTSKASARLKACDLLASFAHRLPDEAKLDRILPYTVGLLSDKSDAVKVAALHATTSILDSVRVVSPVNAYLFPEYIFPKLRQFLSAGQAQPSTLVRAAYASCLATLALASARMLDMVQAIRADGRMPALSTDGWTPDATFQGLYDVARAELVPYFEESTTLLITDPETSVRRALLGSISRLCMFFGSTKSSDVILSHLNTYLNETDWILKCAFYDALVGVATYVGTSSLEQFILPIMIGSMTDSEHFVVEKVIRSLARMAALGLFQRSLLWNLASLVSRYLVHPSPWLREASAQFIEQASKFLSTADRHCIVQPILHPFMRTHLQNFTEESILDKLKPPLPRAVFDAAVLWAGRSQKSLFWTAASRDGVYNISQTQGSSSNLAFTRRIAPKISTTHKDKDDAHSLDTLHNFGMTHDDEIKLMALREYILRYSQNKLEDDSDEKSRFFNNIVSLAQLDVIPQNVLFDPVQPYRQAHRQPSLPKSIRKDGSRSIADALLDASVNIEGGTLDDVMAGEHAAQPSADSAIPIDMKSRRPTIDEHIPTSSRSESVDRPNIRVDGIKEDSIRRPSSVGGRHALLDADRLSIEGRSSMPLTHRGSTMNLLTRAETVKADAEISTTQETVFGKIDRSSTDRMRGQDSALTISLNATEKSRSKSPLNHASRRVPFEGNYSYGGNDAKVIKLLDSHLAENFPVDTLDFGPPRLISNIEVPIKSASSVNQLAGQNTARTGYGNVEVWKPSGLLLAQFVEHTAAINRVVAAPDHAFFITASDDGTCKVWDTTRLEKNVSARSRYTHRHAPDTKVKSLCFVENTHTFLSAATDGSIHALRVEIKPADGNETARFSRPVLVRDWQIPPRHDNTVTKFSGNQDEVKEYAVWMHHYRAHNSSSVLLAATNKCRVLMIDMKNMELIHEMHNPLHHGTPVTFCIDKKHHWMMLGTSHGILDLWDLRFKLRLRSFGVGGAGLGRRIDRLLLHPSRGHGKWVVVSCGGEISIWDIEKMTCREVLRPSSCAYGNRKIRSYEPWHPDDESSENMLQRFALQVEADETLLQPQLRQHAGTTPSLIASNNSGKLLAESSDALKINSMLIFNDYLTNHTRPDDTNKAALMLSAGADRTIRYWDLAHVDQSFIVSGPMVNVVGEDNKVRARYETSWPTSMSLSGLVQLVEEKLSDPAQDEPRDKSSSARGTPKKKKETAKGSKNVGDVTKASTTTKTPRNTLISTAQEQLLKTHLDDITDLCLLRKPYGCIVSVDKGGAVYVFH